MYYSRIDDERSKVMLKQALFLQVSNMWKIKEILPVKEIFRRLKEEIDKI